jgi:multicomponent Na+:H+ antiporter subunit A
VLVLLLALHAVLAVAAPVLGRRLGPRVFLVCALAPAATVAWAATRAAGVLDGSATTQVVSWVPGLGLDLALRLDGFALLMVALVSGIGTLIFAYSRWYFSPRPGLGRFAGVLTAFAGSMLGVVLADNLLLIYVFWELTSVTSYLLIGFEDDKGSARAAALQAILVTVAGGLAMLAGFVLVGQAAGTYSLSAILADPPGGGVVGAGLVLVLLGAGTKSAQVPFHFWLPAAMAAPTPVSAYLHSATLVKAGVYLVARLAPAFAAGYAFWRPLVMGLGVATMLVGGWRALRQHDLKLLLAYGTVSQLGFMVVLVGAGIPELTFAGAALIVAHGLFKAALFMVVGIVDHQAHTRDLRMLSGLGRRMPAVAAVAAVAVASMAGVPLLLGFLSKEAAYEGLLHADLGAGGSLALAGVVAGSVLTFAYGARFVLGGFGTSGDGVGGDLVGPDVARPAPAFVVPAALLAVLTVAAGVVPAVVDPLVGGGAGALDPAAGKDHLALWHGFTAALGLSALTLAAGALLVAGAGVVERAQARMAGAPSAAGAYAATVTGLNRVADRVTGVLQNGSLPIYLGVILLTVLALPGVALLTGTRLPDGVVVGESPLQAVVAVVVLVAALGAAVARRRFAAVLFLGGVGFGVAVLFVIQGAPDLALTQLLVETLAVVIFVLVLRHLPERFEPSEWRLGQATRMVLAGGVGVFVTAFSLVAAGARTAEPVSGAYLEQAVPEAGGQNVVNVILVDFRAFDTLGEITVLTVAALGIVSLVRAGHRPEGPA